MGSAEAEELAPGALPEVCPGLEPPRIDGSGGLELGTNLQKRTPASALPTEPPPAVPGRQRSFRARVGALRAKFSDFTINFVSYP